MRGILLFIIHLNSVKPLNNGHSGDRPLVHCREVVPISEVTECMLQSVGGKQFVRSTEAVHYLRVLSEVPYYCSQIQSNTYVRNSMQN